MNSWKFHQERFEGAVKTMTLMGEVAALLDVGAEDIPHIKPLTSFTEPGAVSVRGGMNVSCRGVLVEIIVWFDPQRGHCMAALDVPTLHRPLEIVNPTAIGIVDAIDGLSPFIG